MKNYVEELNLQQNSGNFHPYTCDRKGKNCEINIIPRDYSKDGVLIATESGWICPCGEYKQNFGNYINKICTSCHSGKLEFVEGFEPYNIDHLMCNICDSTFTLS